MERNFGSYWSNVGRMYQNPQKHISYEAIRIIMPKIEDGIIEADSVEALYQTGAELNVV